MAKQQSVTKARATKNPKGVQKGARGRGRPTTIDATVTVVTKMPPALVEAIGQWAEKRSANRSDAVRQLIEAGLKRRPKQ
jgi:hypothetical protein